MFRCSTVFAINFCRCKAVDSSGSCLRHIQLVFYIKTWRSFILVTEGMQIHVKIITKECRCLRFWVSNVTHVGSINNSKGKVNLTLPCTTSGLLFLSGRAVQFPVDAHCGLITRIWRHDVAWQPRATDLGFSSLFCPFPLAWWLTKNSSAGRISLLRNWILVTKQLSHPIKYNIKMLFSSPWCHFHNLSKCLGDFQ